ncbi:hypothetical protein [Alteribacter aurantiacus]|uniref:hypothetical protein n=1 Tax=Alteribacter aurantiacus TaxID=254410 RepID=UPI00040B0E5C|nr:hypothetical protein [Alteribacter aurantiacus]
MFWKKSMLYFALALTFIAMFFVGERLTEQMYEQMARSFEIMPYALLIPLTGLPLGLILGAQGLIKEFKMQGRWLISWEKLIFFGLPFLYMMLYPVLAFSGNIFAFSALSMTLLNSHSAVIGGMVFGYVIVTSFYKREEHSKESLDEAVNQ